MYGGLRFFIGLRLALEHDLSFQTTSKHPKSQGGKKSCLQKEKRL
jgi:hypothetical protein